MNTYKLFIQVARSNVHPLFCSLILVVKLSALASMLCAVCVSMFQGPSKEGNHHATFGHLVRAADSGCKICKFLCRLRDDCGPDEANELQTHPFIRFWYEVNDTKAPKILFEPNISWLDNSRSWKSVDLYISDLKATPEWWPQFLEKVNIDRLAEPWRVRNDNFLRRSITVNTGDEVALSLASEWLISCKSHHNTCEVVHETCGPKYCPTRLLDIANIGSQACRLLVVENVLLLDDGGYVALSHCWGKNPSFLTLTSDNMDEIQQIIPFHRLPKSIVDSIQICRRLGFRYLWIDGLCIIQSGAGFEEDWQLNAATMDLVYANCELNLAVVRAENPEPGAFVDRDPDVLQTASVYVPVTMELHDETDIHSSTITPPIAGEECLTIEDETARHGSMASLVTIFAPEYDYQSALWKLPLQKRGWVVQERLMAQRTLHFGNDRICWQCNERLQNEYLLWGLPESGIMFDEHFQQRFSLPDIVSKPAHNSLTEEGLSSLQEEWYSLVSDYSGTDLTYGIKTN
jgi:hypothetical protein